MRKFFLILFLHRKKKEFDFYDKKRSNDFELFFSDFFLFSNHFKMLIEKKNLISLHRSLDKVVGKIFVKIIKK